MLRLLLKIGCLLAGITGGWFVYRNLTLLFEGWIPVAAAGGVAIVVFGILYFPLARPIADAADDRLSVMLHRGRHIRTGSGLEDVPDIPLPVSCNICGGPGGPICAECDRQLTHPPER